MASYKPDVTFILFWVCSFLAAWLFPPDASYLPSSGPPIPFAVGVCFRISEMIRVILRCLPEK